MIWSIAWRNVWRNKLRSLVVMIALILGMFAGVFSAAFMKGMSEQRIKTAIEVEGLAHLQLHQKEFRDNMDLHKYIANTNAIVQEIEKDPDIKAVSPRIIINTLAASAKASTGVKLIAVNPAKEKQLTSLSFKIIEGTYLDSLGKNSVVIGKSLADKLKLKLRSKLIIKFVDMEGNQTAGAFKIAGIFHTSNTMFDEMNVYARYQDVTKLIGFPDGAAHEIAVVLKDKSQVTAKIDKLTEKLPQLEVLPWNILSPEVGFMDEMMDQYMYLFIVIILLALCFAIINTMLMVVLERVKELGMLKAVGMNSGRIFKMIMLETVFLVFSGGIIGIIAGIGVTKYFSNSGLNLSTWGEALNSIGYDSVVYPYIDTTMTVTIIILVIFTGMFSSIYPARKALKFKPAEALRTE